MTAEVCSTCGGDVVETEVTPIQMWEGFAIAVSLASLCSLCGHFAGEACAKCGGRVLWEWHGPGQALWVARGARIPILPCICRPVHINGDAPLAGAVITVGYHRPNPLSVRIVDREIQADPKCCLWTVLIPG